MVNKNITAQVVVNILAQVKVDGNLFKDRVLVKTVFGRNAELRTVQGGLPDLIPNDSNSTFELESALTTDLIDSVNPPTDTKSLSYFIYQIHTLGKFPIITVEKIDSGAQATPKTGNLKYDGWITEVVPGDKVEGESVPNFILRGQIKAFTQFLKA